MKIIKIFGIILLALIVLIGLTLSVLKVNHEIQIRKEGNRFPAPGKMVNVNGKNLHVYSEGKGDITLVFLAGHGTISPTLDFKPLWTRMTDEYRIAVVERSGYGWSESTNSPRDIDTLLGETRKALEQSGEKGPYVLVPHSMSGLEAIYWAQKYPEEVTAIIGLDPLTPATYQIMTKPQKRQLYPMYLISRLGFTRLMPDLEVEETFPLMKSDFLTEEEKQNYLTIFYRTSLSKEMLNEIDHIEENVKKVAENEFLTNTPMYFFISEEQEDIAKGWVDTLTNYLSRQSLSRHLRLDTGHYVHYEKAEIIAEEAKAFLNGLK